MIGMLWKQQLASLIYYKMCHKSRNALVPVLSYIMKSEEKRKTKQKKAMVKNKAKEKIVLHLAWLMQQFDSSCLLNLLY